VCVSYTSQCLTDLLVCVRPTLTVFSRPVTVCVYLTVFSRPVRLFVLHLQCSADLLVCVPCTYSVQQAC